jgi:glycosyltransferase involved in cell wall biosynthesis
MQVIGKIALLFSFANCVNDNALKNIRVLILSTYFQKGGAAIAAGRLWHALRKHTSLEVNFLHAEPAPHSPEEGVYSCVPSVWRQKQWWLRFGVEEMSMRLLLRNREDWFQFSLAPWGIGLHRHPLLQEADIIHLHWINDAFLSMRSLRHIGMWQKPIVVTMHDMWTFTGGCHYSGDCNAYEQSCARCPKIKTAFHPVVRSHRQRKAQFWQQFSPMVCWVGCSRWLAECARASGLLDTAAIHHIPNPLDTNQFQYLPQEQAKSAWQLPPGRFVLLCGAASLKDRRKGMDILLEALRLLEKQYPAMASKILFCTFGKAVECMSFDLIEHRHLGNFLDPKELNLLYAAADAYVLTSRQDNLPNTIMEAMASGTPVLATPVGGIPEMIAHGQNGFLMRDLSPQACVEGILFLLEKANTLRLFARQWVETHYSGAVIAQQYSRLYEELLRQKR